jgi:hypothetical protein
MNRTEALAALKNITTLRTTVHGASLGTGFFFADAATVLGGFDRASRNLSALIKVGRVRCTSVQIGATFHDFYAVV